MIPAGFIPFRDKSLTGFNAPLEFLTGFTQVLSKRYAILGLQYAVLGHYEIICFRLKHQNLKNKNI